MPLYESDDIITNHLRDQNIQVHEYNLKNGINLGGVYESDSSELAYRYEVEENTVIIIFYKRTRERKGLNNSYCDVNKFLTMCARLNVRYAKTMVSGFYVEDKGLSRERMIHFYKRFFKAYHVPAGQYEYWMEMDLDLYRAENNILVD